MITITNKILKFKPMIKMQIVTNYILLTIITLNFTSINSAVIQYLKKPIDRIKKTNQTQNFISTIV